MFCGKGGDLMKIPVLLLEDGSHVFEEIIEPGELNFIEADHYPNDIRIQVQINKFNNNITCHVHVETVATYTCDRCLSEYNEDFSDDFEMIFHIGKNDFEVDEDDVILIAPETKEIDLNERIIESLVLGVPMKKLCKADCKGICPHCGADLNKEACKCPAGPIDPRWDELRKLLK